MLLVLTEIFNRIYWYKKLPLQQTGKEEKKKTNKVDDDPAIISYETAVPLMQLRHDPLILICIIEAEGLRLLQDIRPILGVKIYINVLYRVMSEKKEKTLTT